MRSECSTVATRDWSFISPCRASTERRQKSSSRRSSWPSGAAPLVSIRSRAASDRGSSAWHIGVFSTSCGVGISKGASSHRRLRMDALPPKQREAVALAFLEDMTHEQVAEANLLDHEHIREAHQPDQMSRHNLSVGKNQ